MFNKVTLYRDARGHKIARRQPCSGDLVTCKPPLDTLAGHLKCSNLAPAVLGDAPRDKPLYHESMDMIMVDATKAYNQLIKSVGAW